VVVAATVTNLFHQYIGCCGARGGGGGGPREQHFVN
jgi:hypothetical protein